MPRATSDHRSKKNPQMNEAWKRRKKAANAANTSKAREQKWFRTDALKARAAAGALTEKNRMELTKLGINLE